MSLPNKPAALILGALTIALASGLILKKSPPASADSELLSARNPASRSQPKPVSPKARAQAGAAKSLPLADADEVKSQKDFLKAQIQSEKNCYQVQTCNFPQTDPHSYSFAIGRKIAADLAQFQVKYAARFPEDARALANEFLSNEDGYVQEAALKILQQLPPTAESLSAVAGVVTATNDPSIVVQAMDELERYLGETGEPEVHRAIGAVLSTGGKLTSQQAARLVLPFINAKSAPYYEKILSSLSPGSEVGRNLKICLQEFRLKASGG